MDREVELLAPAGGIAAFHAAVRGGADAVYLGLQSFNARRGADNFTIDTFADACAFAHLRGVNVYVALNTAILPGEVDSAFEITLAHLMNPQSHFQQQAQAGGRLRHWWAMPSTDENGQARFVWGASAGILRSLYQFLRAENP